MRLPSFPSALPVAISLITALALPDAPAYAGRASACKAPPFSVPSETQRAVDAAIDARVVGTGAGGVSTTVEARTEYETTTLSQDAVARAWAEYTLCLKLAKKLISQDLHDELLRGLMVPPINLDPSRAPAPLEGASPPSAETTPDALLGTWQVVSRYRDGSCPEGVGGGSSAYTWLLSLQPAGEVGVAVQGQTSYDELRGTFTDGHLRLGAPVNKAGAPVARPLANTDSGTEIAVLSRTDFDLHLEGDALVGSREAAIWSSTLSGDDHTLTISPCVLHYDVRGTR